jgi:regulator of nucleoside diphosphate kinase
MREATRHREQLDIIVSAVDHDRLSSLARSALDRLPDMADELLSEMDRATIASADAMPAGVVRMGSTVTFRNGGEDTRRITLVYPGQADIAENKISILTPLGTALIGLAAGQSVVWKTRDGKERVLDIAEVEPPSPDAQS